MIVDTQRLFCRLLRTFEITTICDVGSMDGGDALRFRRARPRAAIIALEPNPQNVALMQADEQLRQKRIQILPFAASDRDAEAPFFVVKAGNGLDVARRGMSSLHRRAEGSLLAEVVQIRTVRIDNVLAAEARAGRCIALWIDSEGMAFEVIAGASGVLGGTQMLHVEVETEPCIGADQRLLPDVERTLYDAGFVLLATDKPRSAAQLNALFVRGDALSTRAGAVRWHIAQEQLHWNTKRARRFLSLSLRRFLTIRFHSRPSRERSAS